MLVDQAPDSVHDGVTYGAPQITAQSQVTGTISCALSDLSLIDPDQFDYTSIQCTANGQVTMEIGGSFTLTVAATPSSTGVLDNPIRSNVCQVVTQLGDESDQNNNDCSDAVTVLNRPDLTATKADTVGGSTELAEGAFKWSIVVANEGGGPAVLGEFKTVFLDTLSSGAHPDVLYAEPMITSSSGVVGPITCLNPLDPGYAVQCLTDPSGSTIEPGGFFTVEIEVTPLVDGTFVNPQPGGLCGVDHQLLVDESDEDNNDCSASVDVALSPDVRATKTNDVDGVVAVGVPFTWTILLENVGGAELVIPDGETVLVDYLPEGMTYGNPVVTEVTAGDLAGPLDCQVVPANEPSFPDMQVLECTAGSGGIGVVAGGAVTIDWVATPTINAGFDNPHEGFTCRVDPDDVEAELDETNNDCADRVETPIFADGFESGNTNAWN